MSCTGELEMKTFNFIWKICDFSKQGEKVGDVIYSPMFKIGDTENESQLRLSLFPYGNEENSKDYISLYVQNFSTNSFQLRTYAFTLSLLDDGGNKRCMLNSSPREFELNSSWGWKQFCKRDILINEKDTLLINDRLTVYCFITFNPYSSEELKKEEILLTNYETLYSSAALSDVTIVIGEKKIKAHKNILSSRCKVFHAMFEHDMKEKNSDTIEIDDIKYEIMDELLLFLYCGKVRDIKKLAQPLLIAADKYDISSLKAICERTLFEQLQVEDSCEVLVVADRYNSEKLKSDTIDFVVRNIKDVISTSKFKELKIANPELLEDLVCKMALHNV